MDINARIKWVPGMELTAQTFSTLDDNFELRQMISVRTANGLRIGRLPNTPFNADGLFVRNTYELEHLQCTALLSSGMIVSVDERMVVPITPTGKKYSYLTVGFADDLVEYEANDQTMLRPTYCCQFKTLDEMENNPAPLIDSVFPLVRFKLEEGHLQVDRQYIPPCLVMDSDERLENFRQTIIDKLKVLADHTHLEEGDGKRTLQRYLFQLSSYNRQNTMESFMQLLASLAHAINYFIILPNEEKAAEVQNWSQYDVELWLTWFVAYLEDACKTLDKVVLVDNSIDYEQLKAELRKEILEVLQPDMHTQIAKLRTELNEELRTKLSDALRVYIDGTFRRQLHDGLQVELSDHLSHTLFDSLYKALYDALYVPPVEEEDNFMPQI